MLFSQTIPLSLYIHYPWCIKKCPYCDFNSHEFKKDYEQEYLEALIKQLEQTLPMIWGRRVNTIFFGGGTPSLISEKGLNWLLSELNIRLNFDKRTEITLEANPGSVDYHKFSGFRQAGINRLSIGIQSFSDKHLKILGRIHSSQEAIDAIKSANKAGFDNINLDLMFGLPEQTLDQALKDVEQALEFCPTHLSHYQLTLEPNTHFYKQPPVLPNSELIWQMQTSCRQIISSHNYGHYEVSAYSKTSKECQHNLNYWTFGDYIGLGAGAHGKITMAGENRIIRTQMPTSPKAYIMETMKANGSNIGRVLDILEKDIPFEFMLNYLRLQQSLPLSFFTERTGITFNVLNPTIDKLVEKKLVVIKNNNLDLTQLGHDFLNDVIEVFIHS